MDGVLRKTNPNLLLLTVVRDEGPGMPFTALTRYYGSVVGCPRDEQWRAVGLAPTLDRPAGERRYVETAVTFVPAKSVHVSDEDLIL